MSENVKFRFDQSSSQTLQATPETGSQSPADDLAQVQEAESQMRRALGLLGEPSKHRHEPDRTEAPRGADRFNGGLHRRRFIQDGDVPVTVLRRDAGHDAPAHRSASAPANSPSSSRLQRTEAALAAETAGREKAERMLAEAQAMARDLQTKIGHADLAKNEAVETLLKERESVSGLRAEIEALSARVREAEARTDAAEQLAEHRQTLLADERHTRGILERSLQTAESERDVARELAASLERAAAQPAPAAAVRQRSKAAAAPRTRQESASRRQAVVEPEVVPAPPRRGRPAAPAQADSEPEPVKWWLAPAKPATKRR